jgi:HTH-type transcriptional regulator/antitoxin HigA
MSIAQATRKKKERRSASRPGRRGAGISFADLVRQFRPVPIRSEQQYDRTVEVMNRLAVRDERSGDEDDYLDLLMLLVEAYDEEHYDFGPDNRTPLERLKAVMESAGVTPGELGKVLGVGKSAVSMILSGKRQLSKQSILKLAERFKMEAGYFL